ncbi:MAG: hypothetical protein OXC11_06800, partial [Rhodospirillales bacterium]|nr:hypothetical protein [Rhodospirillales bacterium]
MMNTRRIVLDLLCDIATMLCLLKLWLARTPCRWGRGIATWWRAQWETAILFLCFGLVVGALIGIPLFFGLSLKHPDEAWLEVMGWVCLSAVAGTVMAGVACALGGGMFRWYRRRVGPNRGLSGRDIAREKGAAQCEAR